MSLVVLFLAAALQTPKPIVPEGDYTSCVISEAGSLDGPAPRNWTISFHELPNYTFLVQPGAYELRGAKIHWTSGILVGREDGDYLADDRAVRFRASGVVPLPNASFITCKLPETTPPTR